MQTCCIEKTRDARDATWLPARPICSQLHPKLCNDTRSLTHTNYTPYALKRTTGHRPSPSSPLHPKSFSPQMQVDNASYGQGKRSRDDRESEVSPEKRHRVRPALSRPHRSQHPLPVRPLACFRQRTKAGAGVESEPSTDSFLSPATFVDLDERERRPPPARQTSRSRSDDELRRGTRKAEAEGFRADA
jgi:hypothetical protein